MKFCKIFNMENGDQVLIRIETIAEGTNVVLETFVKGTGFRTSYHDCKMRQAEKAVDDYDQKMAEGWYQEVQETLGL